MTVGRGGQDRYPRAGGRYDEKIPRDSHLFIVVEEGDRFDFVAEYDP